MELITVDPPVKNRYLKIYSYGLLCSWAFVGFYKLIGILIYSITQTNIPIKMIVEFSVV